MALTTRNRFSRFIAALYESAVPSRDCHVASLLAMTRQGGAAVHQCPCAVELHRAWRSPPVKGTPHP